MYKIHRESSSIPPCLEEKLSQFLRTSTNVESLGLRWLEIPVGLRRQATVLVLKSQMDWWWVWCPLDVPVLMNLRL